MVLDVVVEVTVPGVAHERIENVRKDGIEDGVLFRQNASLVDMLVLHQGVGPDVIHLHDEMAHGMDIGEVPEKIQRTGHQRGEVDEEMRNHDHVGLVSDNFTSMSDIWLQNVPIQRRGNER